MKSKRIVLLFVSIWIVSKISRCPSDVSKTEVAIGLAIRSNGTVSLSVQDHSPEVRTNYIFDRPGLRWVPADIPQMGGARYAPLLVGCDGDNLVFKYGREAGIFK